MAVEIATAYVSLVVSAEGILDNIRQEIAPLDDVFAQAGITAGQQLGTGISSELQAALAEAFAQPVDTAGLIDESAIGAEIDAAVSGADPPPITVEGDTSDLDAALADALDAPRDIPVDADTSALDQAIADATATPADLTVDGDTSALAAAVDAIFSDPQTVDVNADVSGAVDAINSLGGEPVNIQVDADTSDAQDAIDALGTSATKASGGSGGEGLAGLEGAVLGVKAASGGARGEVGGLSEAVGGLGGNVALGLGGLTAFGVLVDETTSKAADAQAQNRLFANTFGDVADEVKQINVGGLVIDLNDLGRESGTTNADLEASATRIGLLGIAAGAAKPQIAGTASDLLGIAGALAVSNPRLGDAASVADTLSRAFSTGRTRALIPYGISLASTAIQQEALRENVGKTADELTGYDKIVAGVTLTEAQFGDTLGAKFASGAQNAQVEIRGLKVELEEMEVAVGGPLLDPLVTSLKEVLPVAEETGVALGQVAAATLPLAADLAPALVPVAKSIGLVADGIHVLADGANALPTPVLVGGLVLIGPAAISAATGVDVLGAAVDFALGPIGIAAGALALLGGAVDLFGSHEDTSKDATKDWTDALFPAGAGADAFGSQVLNLNKDIDDFTGKLLSTNGGLSAFAPLLEQFGGGVRGVAAALSGSDATFKSYKDDLDAGAKSAGLSGLAIGFLNDALDQQRATLQASEQSKINDLVATNQIKPAQLQAATATVIANEGYADQVAILKILEGEISVATTAAQKHTLGLSEQSGALRDVVLAFKPASDSAADYSTNLQNLGVSQVDADKLGADQVAALQATTDKTLLQGSAVTDLNLAYVQGKIGAGQLEGEVFSLGTSLSAASGDASDLQKEIDAFAKSAVGALPNAGDAVSSFSSGVTKAFGDVVSAAAKSPAEVAKAQAALRAALDPSAFIADLGREAASISAFTKNLSTLVSEGLGQLAGIIEAKGPEIGGQLAATFANDHTKAVAAEGAVELVNSATSSFSAFASSPGVAAQMGAGGTALATAANAGYANNFALEHPTQVQLDQAKLLVSAAEPGLSGAAQGIARAGVVAFEAEWGRLPTVTEIQTGATQATISGATPAISGAAGAVAADATGKYKAGLGLDTATKSAITDATGAFNPQSTIDIANAARAGGRVIGFQFDKGIESGIDAGQSDVAAAAAQVAGSAEISAKARLGIHSPSTAGIAIGANFVSSIALGASDTGEVEGAAAVAAGSLIDVFADVLAHEPLKVTPVLDTTILRKALDAAVKPVTVPISGAPGTGAVGDPAAISAATDRLQQLIDTENEQQQATVQINAANTALQQLVSTAVSALPTAATAVQAFGSAISQAMSGVASAQKDQSKAQAKFDADQAKLKGNVVTAQDQFNADQKAGLSKRQLFLDQAKIDDAQHALNVQTLLDTKALEDANKALATSQHGLAVASDPKSFIAGLAAQNKTVAGFSKDLKVLTGEGFDGLAELLATEGPTVGKALADALAKSPKDARVAESLIDAGKQISTQLSTSLTTELAGTPAFVNAGAAVGAAIGKGVVGSITDTGDVLFTALTAPLSKRIANVPVRQPVVAPVATALSAVAVAGPTTFGPFNFDFEIPLPDGSTARAHATVPAQSPDQLRQRAIRRVVAGARA